jgi:hypothetical protein
MKKIILCNCCLALATVLVMSTGTVRAESSVPARYAVDRSDGDVVAQPVRWRSGYYGRGYSGRGYYGRSYGYYGGPYGAYYGNRYYAPRARYYAPYGGYGYGYRGGYYGPRYGYGYPYGAARVGPVRVFWR